MCQAFSAIVTKKGDVLWEMGMDSHSNLLDKHKIKDDTAKKGELEFARVEISPKNGSYLDPDTWEFHLDERIKPDWWNKGYEQFAWDAHEEWKTALDKILVRKPVVHPFKDKKPPKKITKKHLDLLKQWYSVGDSVWASIGASVWASVVASVGDSVGASIGASVGDSVGDFVWDSVWASVYASVGASVWDSVWDSVRASVYASVGAYTGSFFNLPREAWKYTEKIETEDYPLQPLVDLWEMGLVPSFDGEKWRLHGGKDAKVLWEGKIQEA